MQLVAEGPKGEQFPLRIVELSPLEATLDGNHPLAGQTLHFDVSIREVRAATEEELEHGHAHEPGHSHDN
jgi:FKBP-type peptidyl-prolyl cis-trans isomerase SlyD